MAEQYLIRSEARIQQGNLAGGIQDLNTIRNRAGLSNFNLTDKNSLLTAVLHERQVELFTEWGHRWFDLKRTNNATNVLNAVKGAGWQPFDTLYPVPQVEIQNNGRIVQNAGY